MNTTQLYTTHFYRPQTNVFTPVRHSVHRGGWLPTMHHRPHDKGQGVCIQGGSACMRGVYIWGVGEIPQEAILRDTVNKWAVRILLECILVYWSLY